MSDLTPAFPPASRHADRLPRPCPAGYAPILLRTPHAGRSWLLNQCTSRGTLTGTRALRYQSGSSGAEGCAADDPAGGQLPDAVARDIQALILQTEEVATTGRSCHFVRSGHLPF